MDALSIEEINKIRIAAGAKPLPVPGAATPTTASDGPTFKATKADGDASDKEAASTLETRSAASYDNWKKLEEERKAKEAREARKEALKRARDRAQRFATLEGKGLGESEDAELDAKAWAAKFGKRQKKLERERARKLAEEQAEQERLAELQYTAADLAGVKVAHELGQFEEGEEQILTLADKAVDAEDEEDELVATTLREREMLRERLESKKRKRAYDPNDVDESGQGTILAQYDEEIEGKRRKVFTLDGQGTAKKEDVDASMEDAANGHRGVRIRLDDLNEETPISDYVDPSEVKVRKPKKKKAKASKKKIADDDDIFPAPEPKQTNGNMDVDTPDGATPAPQPKRVNFDEDVIDDDDLQARLAAQRRAALKQRKKTRPEDIAKQLKEEGSATPAAVESVENDEEEPGLIIDETSEFVAHLQRPSAAPEDKPRRKSTTPGRTPGRTPGPASPDVDGDVDMEQSYAEAAEPEEGRERAQRDSTAPADVPATGLEEEATLDQGVGSTIAMLKQRGLIKEQHGAELTQSYLERQRFLADKQKAEEEAERRARAQRERDRQSGRLDHLSTREREEYARQNNALRDQVEARRLAEIFNQEYKPNVELKYVDEFGRRMGAKEAFKHLSHQFHGKGSGKQKTEKRLKRIEEERKREAMSALDSSQHTGMNSAMTATSKKTRQAGVRLQ